MSCESRQQQVSLLIDAELQESDQVALYRHLEECSDCRRFFDSMIRLRQVAREDQETILRTVDEVLPPESPRISRGRSSAAGRWFPSLAGGWRVPAPVAVGLAALLLASGALLGSWIGSAPGNAGLEWRRGRSAEPSVVVVCGLPLVDVVGTAPSGGIGRGDLR